MKRPKATLENRQRNRAKARARRRNRNHQPDTVRIPIAEALPLHRRPVLDLLNTNTK